MGEQQSSDQHQISLCTTFANKRSKGYSFIMARGKRTADIIGT